MRQTFLNRILDYFRADSDAADAQFDFSLDESWTFDQPPSSDQPQQAHESDPHTPPAADVDADTSSPHPGHELSESACQRSDR